MRFSRNGKIYKVEVKVTVERYSSYVEVEATNVETGYKKRFSDVRELYYNLNIKECIDTVLDEMYMSER